MKTTLLVAAACAILGHSDLAAAPPNFIVIIADDMATDDCGAFGHAKIRTPNIDRLAREGLRFDHALLTCSSCSPSRASLLTGRYPHSTGAPELHQPLPAEQVALTEPLRTAGYFTAAAGKWHLGKAAKPKFDVVKEGGGDGAYDHWLPVLRERPKDKPFFLWLASTDPHRGYQSGTIARPHTPDDVVVPPYLADCPETRGDLALYYDEIGRLDAHVGEVLDELQRQGVADNTVVIFLSDNGRPFPRCKTTVYDSGVQTPLIVRWPARIKPGAVAKNLVSSVDIAPTVVDVAGAKLPDAFQGKSFATMFDDPAAETRPYAFSEHNWHDYMAFERGVRGPRFHYIRNGLPEVTCNPPADAVRSPTFQAMRRLRDEGKLKPEQLGCFTVPRPREELYDTQNDPHELQNLADAPQHAAVLAEMRKALDDWQRATADAKPERLTPDKFDRETAKAFNSTAQSRAAHSGVHEVLTLSRRDSR